MAAPATPSTPIQNEPAVNPQPEPLGNNPSNDKPFDDEPFDAGVEADEATDPKKFIEQLTGKLGQSLRKYNEQQGQPDMELEKFAINSLLAATHTAQMPPNDQEDIIKKVKSAGNDSSNEPVADIDNDSSNEPVADIDNDSSNEPVADIDNAEEPTAEVNEMNNLFIEPKKNNMFQPTPNQTISEGLQNTKKMSIFDKNYLKKKLLETFNQEDMEKTSTEPAVAPTTKPETKPETKPTPTPSRKNKPFLPMPNVQPDPKAINNE